MKKKEIHIDKFIDWASAWSESLDLGTDGIFVEIEYPGDDNCQVAAYDMFTNTVTINPFMVTGVAIDHSWSVAEALIKTLGHELRHADQCRSGRLPMPHGHASYDAWVSDPAERDADAFGELLWQEIPMDLLNEVRSAYNSIVVPLMRN